jgi:hypothetical protein
VLATANTTAACSVRFIHPRGRAIVNPDICVTFIGGFSIASAGLARGRFIGIMT